MLLQFRELGEFRDAEYGEDDRDPTPHWLGCIQSSLGGDKEAFERFATCNIGRFPGDYGGTIMYDLYGSALRPVSDHPSTRKQDNDTFGCLRITRSVSCSTGMATWDKVRVPLP